MDQAATLLRWLLMVEMALTAVALVLLSVGLEEMPLLLMVLAAALLIPA